MPLYQLFGGKAREHIELYATSGLPPGLVPPAEAAAMSLKDRAAATMAAGYRVFRVDCGDSAERRPRRQALLAGAAGRGRGRAAGRRRAAVAAGGGRGPSSTPARTSG